jgi:hypothetical protein
VADRVRLAALGPRRRNFSSSRMNFLIMPVANLVVGACALHTGICRCSRCPLPLGQRFANMPNLAQATGNSDATTHTDLV